MDIEERVIKIEKEIEYLKENYRETKEEIKAINITNSDFNLKMERLSISLDENSKSINKLNEYMEKQQHRGNIYIYIEKVIWLAIGGIIGGLIKLLF